MKRHQAAALNARWSIDEMQWWSLWHLFASFLGRDFSQKDTKRRLPLQGIWALCQSAPPQMLLPNKSQLYHLYDSHPLTAPVTWSSKNEETEASKSRIQATIHDTTQMSSLRGWFFTLAVGCVPCLGALSPGILRVWACRPEYVVASALQSTRDGNSGRLSPSKCTCKSTHYSHPSPVGEKTW